MSASDSAKEGLDKVVAIVTSGAGGAAGAIATGAAAAAGPAAFWALFPAAVSLAVWAGFEWRRARADLWWKSVVGNSGGKTPQEIEGILEANKDRPWARETVLESVRRLLESVCDEAAPALGALTAEYLAEAREPDAFFRGAARALADFDKNELLDLRELLKDLAGLNAATMTVEEIHVSGVPQLHVSFVTPEVSEDVVVDGQVAKEVSEVEPKAQFTSPTSFLRVAHVLKVNGLARDNLGGFWGSRSGPNVAVFSQANVEKLLRLIA